ncbi:DUF2207 domain-containing protein [Kineococcus sp. NPDC059986]|uniref:DUF2207 domain-containing protein n=1 Tax=Kineococcus sp. NPDC059986 TaxID=3155538 RepID=UPI003450BA18
MRSALLGVLGAAVLVAGPMAVPAAADDGERVDRLSTQLTLGRDGSLAVREEITYDFGSDGHHGLERVIPVQARYDQTHDRSYPVRDLRVSSPTGAASAVQTETDGDLLDVKVGDPDRDDVTGRQTYVLTYTVPAVADALPDGSTQIAWDAVGTGWTVPVDRADVTLNAPGQVGDVRCVHGPEGSTSPCTAQANGAGATYSATDLADGEGVTVSAVLPAGALTPAPPLLVDTFSPARAFALTPASVGGAGVVLLAGLATALGLRRRRDRTTGPASVDVTGLPPGVVGAVVHGHARDEDVVATLLHLAERGHLTITEVPGPQGEDDGEVEDWALERRTTTDKASRAEQRLLATLFDGGADRTTLSAVRTTARAGTQLTKEFLEDDAVARGLFTARPSRVVLRRLGVALLVVLAGVLATVALAVWSTYAVVGLAVVVVGVVLAGVATATAEPRTRAGLDVRSRADDFRGALAGGAGERSTRLLPYAVALGATQQWADGARLLSSPVPAPTWYEGRAASSSTFNVALFAGSMGGFSASTSDALTAAPPSTASTSGGSYGGGYTGGAAGGGGGGSW